MLGPPAASNTSKVASGRGSQMSQNLFKKSLFEPITVCCWPTILVKIAPNRSFFTLGPPLPARNTSKVASGEGGPEVSNVCQNSLLEQILVYCWPRLLVKMDPNRSFFTSWGLAGAPTWPEFHRIGLLGCFWVLPSALLKNSIVFRRRDSRCVAS